MDILRSFERQIPGVLGAVVGFPYEEPAKLRPDEIFPAASLIKIPILVHLLLETQTGNIHLNEELKLHEKDKVGGSGILFELHEGISLTILDLATLMIIVSDNTATNMLMDKLGMEKIQKTTASLGLQKTILGRKMMVAPNDPPANFTTPGEMFLLLKKLIAGEILTSKTKDLALSILFKQQYNEKIPLLLPKGIRVAHKTAEISGVRHDCGIIEQGGKQLIVCLLTKNLSNELQGDRILAELSRELYHVYFR